MNKTIKREIEVAFSKKVQPVWFRILKYVLLSGFIYIFWGAKWFWIVLIILFVCALSLHFWVRYKTKGWTKSYGAWKYDKHKPESEEKT
jgi:hypothetical protein